MATESVKILIEAEDKASAQIVAATKKIEGTVKATKDLTKNAKSSTEIFGSLAGALGGTEIGSFANQIGGLTGKLGEFAEISKIGGAGAMAFKAGLAGVVGVLSFQVGSAIGNLVFETDKWNAELEKSIELSKKMASELNRLADVRLGDELAEIRLLEDPQKQIEAIKKLSNDAGKEVSSLASQIAEKRKELEAGSFDADADIFGGALTNKTRVNELMREIEDLTDKKEKENARALALDKQAGDMTRQIDTDKMLRDRESVKSDKDYLASLDKQLSMLQAIKKDSQIDFGNVSNVERLQKEIQLLEQQKDGIAALREQAKQSTSGIVVKDVAGSVVGIDGTKEAESKLIQIKLIEKQTELEKLQREEKKAAIKEISDAEFAATMAAEKAFMSERDRLAEQKVLLNQGAEAAHAFRLEKQGLSEEDAKSFAKQQTELDKQKQVQDKMKARETAAPLQAFSSRFLTRGPTDDKMLDIAKTQLKVQQEQLVELKKPKETPKTNDLRIQVAG